MNLRVIQASMLLEQGRWLEAETLLRAAIEEGVRSANVHAMLALCLRRAGVHDAASDEIKAALAIDANCAYAHYVLSFPSAATKLINPNVFLGQCIKHILRALEIEPNNVSYLGRLAYLRQQSRQWKQSLEPIDAALRLAPRNVGLAVQRAEALIHLGQRQEAHETLLRALQADPAEARVHAGMGWALLRTGDHQRAKEFFEEALRLHPDLEWAQHGAFECAKNEYRLYRVLSYFKQRWVHRPGLRLLVEMGISVVWLLAVFGLLFWIDPIIRPRWGGAPIAIAIVPLLLIPFALDFCKEPLFSWLVRRHRAAQLSATEPIVKGLVPKFALTLTAFAVGIFFAVSFDVSKSPLIFALLGLTPGVACLGVTLFDVPGCTARKWLMLSSILVLIAGPILLVMGREYILDLNPDPRSATLLAVPPIVIAVISQRLKQKQRIEEHQRLLAASQRKIFPNESKP